MAGVSETGRAQTGGISCPFVGHKCFRMYVRLLEMPDFDCQLTTADLLLGNGRRRQKNKQTARLVPDVVRTTSTFMPCMMMTQP